MGSCIICGSPADGDICQTHEEDVFFEFRGTNANQLTPNRYYRGSVDGFAEFGVFVDVGRVTGLLHRSEIPKRLESLDWDPGEEVFVQVLSVHDNGNIDLGWSLRQAESEFRGRLVDDPDLGEPLTPGHVEQEMADPSGNESEPETAPTSQDGAGSTSGDGGAASEASPPSTDASTPERSPSPVSSQDERSGATGESSTVATTKESESSRSQSTEEVSSAAETGETERVTVTALEEHVGEIVEIEGEIQDVRQTSGPTVFELVDETATVECAAFNEAGVRAYPEIEVGDVVRLVGEVERRRGALQVETTSMDALSGDERDDLSERLEAARIERARPDNTELLVEDETVAAIDDELVDAATTIRRAVFDERPVIIRHTATLEGYVAGTALERALLPIVRSVHDRSDAEYHYVDRRPIDGTVYDVEDATEDVTDMLEAADRHEEKRPLFVLVDAGSSKESIDALEFLSIYDAGSVVVDGGYADADAADAADVLVSPTAAGAKPISTGTLGCHLAGILNDDVRDDLKHLPATSYWSAVPEVYVELAESVGYDRDALEDIRNAIALEAYYQSYEDKRELIADLFWDEQNRSLAAPISEQFREKLETEIETASAHLDQRDESGVVIGVLDVDAYTHQYDFPPIDLLIEELHRRETTESSAQDVTIGFKRDELRIESTTALDVRAIGEAVSERLPEAGVTPRGGRDGRIDFLAGEREAVLEAVIDEVATWLG